MKKTLGFTLIELMVAIAVAAILLAIAAPNFTGTLKTSRVQSVTREVYSQLAYARSEAVSQGKTITMCHSANGSSCGGTWDDGWMVCVDNNRDNSCAGEKVLRKFNDLKQITLRVVDDGAPAVAQDFISFGADGGTSQTNKLSFVICPSSAEQKYARAVLKVGRGQLLMSPQSASGIYKDATGADLTCP